VSIVQTGYPYIFAILFSNLVGACAALISFMPVHEGSHSSTTESIWGWRLLGATHDYINGASFYTWLHQHFLGHHPFTNITATDVEHYGPNYSLDPDTVTGDRDVRRIKPHQKWYHWYRNQHIYVPLLYSFLGIKYRINDMIIMHTIHKNGEIRMNTPGAWHKFNFYAGKLFWLFYRFVLPIYYIGFVNTLILFFASDFVTGWMLAFIFQVNHVIPQAIWPKIVDGRIDMDWAIVQMQTTMDYAHDSYITTFLTGALNFQVVHHLVPYVSQIHYPAIAPIIKKVCEKHGVHYNHLPTFSDALWNHITYLKDMGQKV